MTAPPPPPPPSRPVPEPPGPAPAPQPLPPSLASPAAAHPQGEAWLRSLLEHPSAILFTLGADGRIRWISPQVKAILGLEPGDAVGVHAIGGLAEGHQAVAQEHARAKAEGREEKATYETMVRAADGREVWLEVTSHAERDAHGRLAAVHGVALDVTERRLARNALARSRQRLASLLDDANDVVYLHDLEGRFLAINAAATATYGYTQEEFLRMSIRDLVDPEHLPRAAEEMRLKAEGKKQRSAAYELLTRAKDGRPVWVEVSTRAVLRDGQAMAIQGIARDVSRRRADEAAVRLVQRLAVAAADARDLDAALAVALEGLLEATPCARAEAWAPAADGRLHLAAAWPEERSPQEEKFHRLSQRMELVPADGVAGRAWREGKALWLGDLAHDPAFLRAASAQAAGFHALLAVPILADGAPVALLLLFLRERPGAAPPWAGLVESVAAQLGAILRRRGSEDRLRSQDDILLSQWLEAPVAVLLVGGDGSILGANRRFLQLCGVAAPEGPLSVGPEFLSQLADPAAFTRKAAPLYETIGTGADEVQAGGRILRRYAAALQGPDGTLLGKAVYLRDVTEARAMERQLAAYKASRQDA